MYLTTRLNICMAGLMRMQTAVFYTLKRNAKIHHRQQAGS